MSRYNVNSTNIMYTGTPDGTEVSYIRTGAGGTAFVGPDAVALHSALTLRHALLLFARAGIRPNAHVGPKRMLELATGYTGKAYKLGNAGYVQAADDLKVWCDAMNAALPHETTE